MLGEKIKAGRHEKGLSQQEFADRLSVVRQTVSKWEKGLSVPDSDMLLKIADILEISVSEGGVCSSNNSDTEISNISEIFKSISESGAESPFSHFETVCRTTDSLSANSC